MKKLKNLAKRFIRYYGQCMYEYGESIMVTRGCGY